MNLRSSGLVGSKSFGCALAEAGDESLVGFVPRFRAVGRFEGGDRRRDDGRFFGPAVKQFHQSPFMLLDFRVRHCDPFAGVGRQTQAIGDHRRCEEQPHRQNRQRDDKFLHGNFTTGGWVTSSGASKNSRGGMSCRLATTFDGTCRNKLRYRLTV